MPRSRQSGVDTAIRVLKHLVACEGECSTRELGQALDVPRASLYRIIRTMARSELLDIGWRGRIRVGPAALKLSLRRNEVMRAEDADRVVPRPKFPGRATGAGYGLSRRAASVEVRDCSPFRRAPKFRIGFANAAVDNPWRIALVHSVEYGAVRYRDLVSGLCVRHAAQEPERQADDIDALLAMGVDGLIVSAVQSAAIAPALACAERNGVPAILVDRGLPDLVPHVSFVTCDDEVIGRTTALWLAELLGGVGGIVLLPGLEAAEPAQRRLAGARGILDRFDGIQILATRWTGWDGATGRRIMSECLKTHDDDIAGVWCDSGLQAVGSLQAFVAARREAGRIPPHTGDDINLAYKLAVRHRVALAAVDYPPAMGLRSVEVLLDVLRGRGVPRRIDVPTEVVVTRGHATASVHPNLWADEHVRWDLPDDLVLASGLGASYDPRRFRVRYKGNRYNRSAAGRAEVAHHER